MRLSVFFILGLPLALAPRRAEAYSTRVHIMIANQLREALIESNDGSIPLLLNDEAVLLSDEDFEALRDHPLEFRAGAVGPDNMVFPGMTDPSHAVGQRPYDQCELLYQAAVIPSERAYALGCFVHGSTDAIAHHYVNYMAGETFTLTPLSSDRATQLSNVVRHILAESAIQNAAYVLDPEEFSTGRMLHNIPLGFVQRTYLNEDSELWQLMAGHAKTEYDAVRATMPDAALPDVVAAMDVAPADHLVLSPIYLDEVGQVLIDQRASLEASIADMQDPASPQGAELRVSAGADGVLGTQDDNTACALSCAAVYATYFTYVGLLAPRYDAMGEELPSAFDKIGEELEAELFAFHPAYLETVGNISAKLNEPLTGVDPGVGFSRAEIAGLFTPLTNWADDVATIDYDTLVHAVIPEWIIALDTAMQAVDVDVDLAGTIEAVFQPYIAPIREAIQQAFIVQAEVFLGNLVDEFEAAKVEINNEYDGRLDAAAAPELDGNVLDHFYASGLYAHSFNIAAATMANHEAVLPTGDGGSVGVGPASFDASYTAAWMQAALCPHLSGAIFPLGIDVRGSLSVRFDDTDYTAVMEEDSPVECHDGSLGGFATMPGLAQCMLTDLPSLLMDPVGSLSRAYPPELSMTPAQCEGTEIPGLPLASDGEHESGDEAGGLDSGPGGDEGEDEDGGEAEVEAGGCSCRSDEDGQRGPIWMLGLISLLGLRRRGPSVRRVTRFGLAALALAVVPGCDDDGGRLNTAPTESTHSATSESESESEFESESESELEPGTTGGDTTGDGDTTGEPPADDLLDALDGTVWHGEQTRDGVTRAYELAFDSESQLWAEIRNPFGPARLREMRVILPTGHSAWKTTVISPQGWPFHPENGREDEWMVELVDGMLRTTHDGVMEEFQPGPWPAPEDGLTAIVRVFEVGGVVDQAFCDSGANGFDYPALFGFANGDSGEIVATDVVAGAQLLTWSDPGGNNQFSVTDVDGFDLHGGTDLSDSFNFFVTYLGVIDHPGGTLAMREHNDSIEDGMWVFLGDTVGSTAVGDLFLEVHGFIWPDATEDEPSIDLPAGDVAIQAIVVRCTEQIVDVDVEIAFGGAGYALVGNVGSTPDINTDLFPPAL